MIDDIMIRLSPFTKKEEIIQERHITEINKDKFTEPAETRKRKNQREKNRETEEERERANTVTETKT